MISKNIQKILLYFEFKSFGVCKWWGRKLGLDSSRVRITFIYTSFFTLGSPLILYFATHWILEHKIIYKNLTETKPYQAFQYTCFQILLYCFLCLGYLTIQELKETNKIYMNL